ncbi:hypothetical protein Ae201684_000030 [Aphanomyces euteiches]|uniref:Uncharacterized protein n=1 Tax=Aphanomyces euteiches TaxID=100861 RepID=A0A6G0XYE1_9STRA|nr:hypothetical protein Ae201684_000030 [Aphanomyces euteiches]
MKTNLHLFRRRMHRMSSSSHLNVGIRVSQTLRWTARIDSVATHRIDHEHLGVINVIDTMSPPLFGSPMWVFLV